MTNRIFGLAYTGLMVLAALYGLSPWVIVFIGSAGCLSSGHVADVWARGPGR